jgi:hypothetical protein
MYELRESRAMLPVTLLCDLTGMEIMADTTTSTMLACPTCAGRSFSWIVTAVQSGTIHQFGERYDDYGDALEDIQSVDSDDHGVICTTCGEEHDRDDLIPADEVDV